MAFIEMLTKEWSRKHTKVLQRQIYGESTNNENWIRHLPKERMRNLVTSEFNMGRLKKPCAEQITQGMIFFIEHENGGRRNTFRSISMRLEQEIISSLQELTGIRGFSHLLLAILEEE